MGKDVLYKLIDCLGEEQWMEVYKYLIQLVPADYPIADEVIAIKRANKEIEQGKVKKLEDIEWG